jgi:Rhodopirellula transposase DDE domain
MPVSSLPAGDVPSRSRAASADESEARVGWMNNNVAGMWRWSPIVLAQGEIGCSPKSLAWMKRPSSGADRNWLGACGATGAARASARRRSAPRRKKDPALEGTLDALVQEDPAGDPMSEQKWVRCSLRQLSRRLKDAGHPASPPTVGRL